MHDKDYDNFFDENIAEVNNTDALIKMIDGYDKKVRTDLKVGSQVSGKVTRISDRYIFVDIGTKNEALMKTSEVTDKENNVTVKIDDTVTAYIIADSSTETVLSKSLGGHSAGIPELTEAMNNEMPVQGKVTGVNKGGLNVKVMGHRAFCPSSQIEIRYVEDVNAYLDKSLSFVITRITEGGRNIVLSRIPLLEHDLEARFTTIEQDAKEHKVLKGKITRITDFGLFVDMGDLEGLVHISEISWERAHDLSETFSVGQDVEFVILKVEKKQPLRNSKISLSVKQILDNPWSTISTKFSVGETVEGTITRVANFGAFVEIAPGIEGLVHVSEMSWLKRVHHPSEVVAPGNKVRVNILGIDETKKTISLSLKDVSDDPWREADEKFAVGTDVQGTVSKKTKYGYFIDLVEGVTGLLPFGNMATDKKDTLKEGETVTIHIEAVDKDQRRISLSMGMKEAAKEVEAVKDFIKKQTAPQKSSSSDFGSALLEALKNKK